jgi:hypothetical protein
MLRLRLPLAAAVLATACCWWQKAAGETESWHAQSGVGVTSPLSHCTIATGCMSLPDAYPALYVQLISARALTIGFSADETDPTAAGSIRIYKMSGAEQRVGPHSIEKVGHSRTVVGFDSRGVPLIEHRLHLLLDEPLVAGLAYEFELALEPYRRVVFTVPDNPISPSIQVNQVGYLPGYAKTAFVGNWLGTAGPMPVDNPVFQIFETASGRLVQKGTLVMVDEQDSWSGNKVLRADFSETNTPGRYQLQVPGIGRSYPFEISETVFQPVYRRVFRLFYHSRNSTAITAPWSDSGLERPGGIPSEFNARFHPVVSLSPLGRGEKPYGYHAVDRGWFDAGDYGQYVVNAAPVWFSFGAGFDISANAFTSDDLGTPESNNGLADVIDELEWGMTWLLSMQDSEDGGVYNRVAPLQWDVSMPHAVDSPRYLFEKTTHATASFAAATAIHARLLRPWKPKKAQLVLAASEAAWKFLERSVQWPEEGDVYRNPVGVHAGEYPDSSATDNRLWAAAELYRATGEDQFLDAFIAMMEKFQPDPTAGVSFKEQGLAAYWAMYLALEPGITRLDVSASDKAKRLRDELSRTLLSSADWYLRKAAEHPFNAPIHQHEPYTGWGSFAQSSRAVLPLLQAWKISGDDKYIEHASEMSNPQLGANPQSICYITGTGSNSPRYPLSKLSQSSGQGLPMTGIPVNGPHYHLPALWPSMRTVNQAYLPAGEANPPDGYPALRRYVDSNLLPPMSEPTVAEYAATAVAFGLLSDGTLMHKANP